MKLFGNKDIRNKDGNVACKLGRWDGSRAIVVSIKKGRCITYIIVFPNLDVKIENYFVNHSIA